MTYLPNDPAFMAHVTRFVQARNLTGDRIDVPQLRAFEAHLFNADYGMYERFRDEPWALSVLAVAADKALEGASK